jgi:hypothetical protein
VGLALNETINKRPRSLGQLRHRHPRRGSCMALVSYLVRAASSVLGDYLTTQCCNLSVCPSDLLEKEPLLLNHSLVTITRTTNAAAFSSSQTNTQVISCSPMRPPSHHMTYFSNLRQFCVRAQHAWRTNNGHPSGHSDDHGCAYQATDQPPAARIQASIIIRPATAVGTSTDAIFREPLAPVRCRCVRRRVESAVGNLHIIRTARRDRMPIQSCLSFPCATRCMADLKQLTVHGPATFRQSGTFDQLDVDSSIRPRSGTGLWHLRRVLIPRRSVFRGLVWGKVWRRTNGKRWIYKKFDT